MSSAVMSSPNTGAEKLEISDMPSEVLQRIFKYLSVNERKTVKLVSKSWLKCCNVISLMDDEVLVCSAIYRLCGIYELLEKSERKFLNLKFENVTFDHGSSFWKRNGQRIRSISFKDCSFPDGILVDIIVLCANLFHLSFTYTGCFQYMIEDGGLLPPIKDLEKVTKKGIIRENLNSLEIDISDSKWFRLSDYILHQLLLIFPKIKILKITSDFREAEVDLNLAELTNRNRVTMSPVLSYLIASSERIEKVKLSFPWAKFSSSSLRFILETISSLKRLTELCISTSDAPILESIDTSFCSKLKSLEFGMDVGSDNLMLFISKLLLSNSGFKYLKMDALFCNSFVLTKSLYEKLMSSGLKSFVFTADEVSIRDCDSLSSCSVQNRTPVLPNLSACFSTTEQAEGMLTFLQYYQTLHHLQVACINENELQFLLKYQKKLRSLKFKSPHWLGNIEIHPEDLTFNELTDIECLELRYPPATFFFLRTLSLAPILSNLKYLFIDSGAVEKMLFPADLLRAAEAMPFLEGLRVYDRYDTIMSFNDIVKLCTKLSRLRYLYYEGVWLVNDGALTDEHYHKVFSICSSLRVLVHFGSSARSDPWGSESESESESESQYAEYKAYFFDTLNKKVKLKPNAHRYALGSPRMGEFLVSWLDF